MIRRYSCLILLWLCPAFSFSQSYSKRKAPNLKGKIEIITLINDKQENKGNYYYEPCDTWHIDKKAAYYIFRHAEIMTTYDLHSSFSVFPCYETGKVKIGDKKYSYSINGGSWFTLSTKDTTYYYGCVLDTSNNKYFLSGVEQPN